MSTTLVPLPVVLPLLAAAVSVIANRHPRFQRALGTVVLMGVLAVSVGLLVGVQDGTVLVAHIGGWESDVGIVLAVDTLSALMLVVSALMLLVVFVYAVGSPATEDDAPFFHPLYLVLMAGVSASFVTADLFNLFVAFEVMLVASYVLITLGGSRAQVRHGMTYVVVSLLASTLFVTAIGLVYAVTGTVNLGRLAVVMQDVDPALRSALGLLLLVVFGVKAAIFPLFSWLPDSYPTAPAPVTAVFAGLLTKVGVYAIIRTQTLLFNDGVGSTLLLVIAGLTMTVGVLGAIAQDDVKRILSFHIVSQIGYMIFGLGLFTLAGIAGAVLYMLHHIVVKTTLFLVAGLLEQTAGTAQLRRLGGLLHLTPVVAVLFLLPALSLAGLPPFSGFVAKLSLVQAGFASGAWVIVGVSLGVSLLTLFSMTKIWNGVFWGQPDENPPAGDLAEAAARGLPRLMVGSTGVLVVVSLAFSVAAAPIHDLSQQAARELLDRTAYVQAVTGR